MDDSLKDLKNKNISAEERAKKLVESLGLEGNERSVVIGLKKGDIFQLSGMNKMELEQRAGQTTKFVPVTFTTQNGASIGAKHFAGLDIDGAPAVGSTPLENANFLVYCIDNEIEFQVQSLTTEEVEAKNGNRGYTKRTYRLAVL